MPQYTEITDVSVVYSILYNYVSYKQNCISNRSVNKSIDCHSRVIGYIDGVEKTQPGAAHIIDKFNSATKYVELPEFDWSIRTFLYDYLRERYDVSQSKLYQTIYGHVEYRYTKWSFLLDLTVLLVIPGVCLTAIAYLIYLLL
jgi:hypothetical protein